MKAAHEDQLKLLDLQHLNQQLSQLRHKRASHPIHETIRVLDGRTADLQRAAINQGAVISDIRRELRVVEDDLEKVKERRIKQEGRLERNEVPLHDLSAVQHEIEQMTQRIGVLEDSQLEIMERLEKAIDKESAMHRESEAISLDITNAQAKFENEIADLDHDLERLDKEREALISDLPTDLIDEYNRAVNINGPMAILEVRDKQLIGAAGDISPAELETIYKVAPDEVYWTEDTEQIVVRTQG